MNATCSPAACATLLRRYGVEASEGQMARACLTTLLGTSNQGIWRALKMYSPDGYEVKLESYKSYQDLAFPVLINAKLKNNHRDSGLYSSEWGWKPGVPHTVVLLGLDWKGKFCL